MGHMDMAVGMSEQAVFLDLDDIGLYSPRANSLTIYGSVASFIINLFKILHFSCFLMYIPLLTVVPASLHSKSTRQRI